MQFILGVLAEAGVLVQPGVPSDTPMAPLELHLERVIPMRKLEEDRGAISAMAANLRAALVQQLRLHRYVYFKRAPAMWTTRDVARHDTIIHLACSGWQWDEKAPTRCWRYNGASGFGLAGIRREGVRPGPIDYLALKGEWPARDFYNEAEYAQLQSEGWEYTGE